MNADWDEYSTGQLFDLINGYAFKSSEFKSSGVPVVKIKNVKAGAFVAENFDYVDSSFLVSKRDKQVRYGDLLITMSGNRHDGSRETWVGKVAWFNRTENYIVNQRVGILRIKEGVDHNTRFLAYQLSSDAFQNHFISVATSSGGQANLSPNQIKNMILNVPSRAIQDRIANVLGTLEDKITLNRQINQTLEAMAQAIFKSWFVDFDPVKAKIAAIEAGQDPLRAAMNTISGKSDAELDAMPRPQYDVLAATAALFPEEFMESELGDVPKGWEVVSLGQELSVLETGTRPKGGVGGITEGVPSVGAENILGIGNYNFGKEKFVSHTFFEKMKRGKVEDFDFLLYKDGGKPGDFKPRVSLFGCGFPYDEFSINEHVFRIRSETLGQPFLYFQIGGDRVLKELSHKGAKAAIPGINQGDVTSTCLVKPSASILGEFNKIAHKKLELILKRSKENNCLAQLRDTLLPKLLSGELSVANLEEVV